MMWDGELSNHIFRLLSSLATWPHCVNVRRIRCQADLNSFPFGELEETTGTPPYYVDEDYPAGPGITEPLPEWSNWRGSETIYSGEWCLCLALSTRSGACQKWMNEVRMLWIRMTGVNIKGQLTNCAGTLCHLRFDSLNCISEMEILAVRFSCVSWLHNTFYGKSVWGSQ